MVSSTTEQITESSIGRDEDQVVPKGLVATGWATLLLAMVEAVCVTFIALSSVSLLLGTGSIVLAKWATYLHDKDSIRLSLLALASLGALTNLLVLTNGWLLRRAPAARWRYRPLTSTQRRRVFLILGSSVVTLAIVAAELYEHRALHGHF